MRSLFSAFLIIGSVFFLTACDPDVDDDFDGEAAAPAPDPFGPLFDPANSVIPFPTNLLFSGSADGTLNIPVEDETDISDPQVALNALDGRGDAWHEHAAGQGNLNCICNRILFFAQRLRAMDPEWRGMVT